jgi:hypothetical protein
MACDFCTGEPPKWEETALVVRDVGLKANVCTKEIYCRLLGSVYPSTVFRLKRALFSFFSL